MGIDGIHKNGDVHYHNDPKWECSGVLGEDL